jgi:hypothetical protein
MANSLGEVLREALARKWAEDDAAHNQMEDGGTKPEAPLGTNVSRATFDYIKANPGKRHFIIESLTKRGYKAASVGSLVAQMMRQGMVAADAAGIIRVTQAEYTPIKAPKQRTKKAAMPKRPVSSSPTGLAALAPTPTPAPAPARALVPVLGWSTDEILENLDVKQAVAVYKELKKLFGEVK